MSNKVTALKKKDDDARVTAEEESAIQEQQPRVIDEEQTFDIKYSFALLSHVYV